MILKNPKLISKEDIINSGALSLERVISEIENSLIAYKNGKILLPDKISQIFDEKTQNRINCMPATLLEEKICGVKWVSVFPKNPELYNIPNVSGVIILSELQTGYPIAILEGGLITAVRTAAIGALASKYFARKSSSVYATIGTGEQAKMHFRFIKQLFPDLKICKVASKTKKDEDKFIEEFKEKFPDVQFVSCNSDFDFAADGADIIVTAVSCQQPLLKSKFIKEGAFYCHVGGYEDEYSVVKKADKIICDSWEAVKHRSQTVSRMYQENLISDNDIYSDLVNILDGTVKGRENEKEFIYFNSVGLAFIDIAVANLVYKETEKKNLGTEINF